MKKITLYIILLFGISQNVNAQRFSSPQNLARYDNKKMHFGFSLGINSLDFRIKYNPDIMFKDSLFVLESQNQKGFNLGIVSNFRIG